MSNLIKRIIAGIFGIPLLLYISYEGGYLLLGLTLILNTIAMWEFCSMFEKKEIYTLKILTVAAADTLLVFSVNSSGISEQLILNILFCGILFITFEIFRKEKRSPINPAISAFGLLYITVPFILMNFLQSQSVKLIIVFIFILIWTCDSMAYFGGRMFGKRKLSDISPNKTWEGSVTGFIFTVIISVLLHFIFPNEITIYKAVSIGILIGIFSQTGDLFESMIKRYCGVKDSSNLIPGHGGILDRFDSLIFVVPVIFILLSVLKGF
ncbi:MAG TPA: phosphatidate cytidylyltransferase [Ignavibacteria bacterium]|nr:phosphatidate cytidylyltransferase [Ignavibacteria bacterium]